MIDVEFKRLWKDDDFRNEFAGVLVQLVEELYSDGEESGTKTAFINDVEVGPGSRTKQKVLAANPSVSVRSIREVVKCLPAETSFVVLPLDPNGRLDVLAKLARQRLEQKKMGDAPPRGFERLDMLSRGAGLRGHLRQDIQAYVADVTTPQEVSVKHVVSLIEAGNGPVAITGEGGSGKTRLAIETAMVLDDRDYWPLLVTKYARTVEFETAITASRRQGKQPLFVIDYVEQLDATYGLDAILNICNSHPDARLLVTARSSQFGRSSVGGPNRVFNTDFFHQIDLSAKTEAAAAWRKWVCQNILGSKDQRPAALQSDELDELEVPAIATLLSFDAKRAAAEDTTTHFDEEGNWLLSRILRRTDPGIDKIKAAGVLACFPLPANRLTTCDEQTRAFVQGLMEEGWASEVSVPVSLNFREHAAVMGFDIPEEYTDIRLGHDLLSDIPLASALTSAAPIMSSRLQDVFSASSALKSESVFRISLARALPRLTEIVGESARYDWLEAVGTYVAQPSRSYVSEVSKLATLSPSLDWSEKLRVFGAYPELSQQQFEALKVTFEDERTSFGIYALLGSLSSEVEACGAFMDGNCEQARTAYLATSVQFPPIKKLLPSFEMKDTKVFFDGALVNAQDRIFAALQVFKLHDGKTFAGTLEAIAGLVAKQLELDPTAGLELAIGCFKAFSESEYPNARLTGAEILLHCARDDASISDHFVEDIDAYAASLIDDNVAQIRALGLMVAGNIVNHAGRLNDSAPAVKYGMTLLDDETDEVQSLAFRLTIVCAMYIVAHGSREKAFEYAQSVLKDISFRTSYWLPCNAMVFFAKPEESSFSALYAAIEQTDPRVNFSWEKAPLEACVERVETSYRPQAKVVAELLSGEYLPREALTRLDALNPGV